MNQFRFNYTFIFKELCFIGLNDLQLKVPFTGMLKFMLFQMLKRVEKYLMHIEIDSFAKRFQVSSLKTNKKLLIGDYYNGTKRPKVNQVRVSDFLLVPGGLSPR